MIVGKIKKWGNSMGLILPKREVEMLNLKENQEVIVEITQKGSPLKEMFGAGRERKIAVKDFLDNRKSLEGKYV